MEDQNPWHQDPNRTHVLLNTNLTPHQSAPPRLNAGVIGFDLKRKTDQRILNKWLFAVRKAREDESIYKNLPWHDQGCLQWVLESENLLHLVSRERKWNELQYLTYDRGSLTGFLESLDLYQGNIVHFVYQTKEVGGELMWKNWGEIPITAHDDDFNVYRQADEEKAKKIKFFVLGDDWDQLERISQRPYTEVVNLPKLTLEESEWQSPQLGDHAIYLSNRLDNLDCEYVGLMTSEYHHRYSQMPLLNDITALEAQLEPNTVLVADLARSDWTRHSEHWHQGMLSLLEELSRETGLDLHKGPTFMTNNYICRKAVLQDFLRFWRKAFRYFYHRYGFDLPYSVQKVDYTKAVGATFYERFAAIYFSNKTELEITPITNRVIYKLIELPSDKLPFVICDYHGNIEAKFKTEHEAWNYSHIHEYATRVKEVTSLEEVSLS
jgi:hypothetical protein